MADARLDVFENYPLFHNATISNHNATNNTMWLHHVYIPGSISFNGVAMIISVAATDTRTASQTISFALYSRNGVSLSLANSASYSSTYNAVSSISWITLATSANQDITPGDWYFGLLASSATAGGAVTMSAVQGNTQGTGTNYVYGGPFVRGRHTSGAGMPAAVATSALEKEGTNSAVAAFRQTYILISA